MFQAALQYKPLIRNVQGKVQTQPARYRRLTTVYDNLKDASYAAAEFHSRYVHRAVTTPVVLTGRSADGSFRFEFVPGDL